MAPPKKKPLVKKPPVKKTTKPNKLEKLVNTGAAERRLPVQEANPKRLTFSQPEKVRMNVMDKLLRQGTPNRATTPRVINQGYTPGSASRAVVLSTATSATSSAGSKTLAFLRGVGSRAAGAAGAIVDPTFMSGKGEGKLNNDPVTRSLEASSTMSAMNKKMKREIRQGSKLAVAGVKEGVIGKTRSLRNKTGQNGPEYPTWKNKPKASKKPLENRLMKPAPGTNYSGQEKKIPRKPAPGTNYSGQGTTSSTTQKGPTTTRPKPLNTLAADYAALQQGQNQGQAKAKNAAPKPNPPPRPPNQVAKSAPVKKVGRLTRAEREGLSTDRMQRKPKGNLLDFLKKRK